MERLFNPEMLVLARQSRGLNQSQLAESAGVKQYRVSRIEGGLVQPTPTERQRLARSLRYREKFFTQSFYRTAMPISFHRKREKLAARDWEAIYARAEVFRLNIAHLLAAVELEPKAAPIPSIDPDQFGGDIEKLAASVRQYWLLPRGAVSDLTKLVEDAGAIIVAFDFGTQLIDGFGQRSQGGLPHIIFMNSSQPKDRWRFTLAHELGHLIMHRMPTPEMERQSNRLAAEFMMPRQDIRPFLSALSLQKFMSMKLHWKMSMAALLYKARAMDVITERSYVYYRQEMRRLGYLDREPVEITDPIEIPTTLRQLLQTHRRELGFSDGELAELFGMDEDEVGALYAPQRPKLRLVA
jgi:Zn-dependent peptidase ImmA (M78 family)/transcriptional regulator with XRE-family HTH domain